MTYFTTSDLSESTISMYTTRITKWCELVPNQSIEYIIRFPGASVQLLLEHLKKRHLTGERSVCTLPNIRNYITPIIAILRYSPHIAPHIHKRIEYYNLWNALCNQISKPMYDRQIQERPTDRQEKMGGSKLSFSDIVAKRDSDGLGMYPRLLLAMYTYLYPVRADYHSTQIVQEGQEPTYPNYLRISENSSELLLRDFKTARHYPPIHYPQIPEELHRMIVASLQEKPRSFLFEGANGKPYTRPRFSHWASEILERLFGVELNITLLRHLFISSLSMDLPLQELQRIGNLMGHSFARQRLYKWRSLEQEESESESEEESESESEEESEEESGGDSDEDKSKLSP